MNNDNQRVLDLRDDNVYFVRTNGVTVFTAKNEGEKGKLECYEWMYRNSDCLAPKEQHKQAIPKEWEILAFAYTKTPHVAEWILNEYGEYENNFSSGWSLDEMLNDTMAYSVKTGSILIHTVKRTTDSTTWTLKEVTEQGEIVKFEIDHQGDLWVETKLPNGDTRGQYFTALTKKKQQQDYTILSFKDKDGAVASLRRNGKYTNDIYGGADGDYTVEQVLKYKWQIFEVKRSDGLSFFVDEITEQGGINKFEIFEDKMAAYTQHEDSNVVYPQLISVLTKKEVKPPIPILTSKDGYTLSTGEDAFYVNSLNEISKVVVEDSMQFTSDAPIFFKEENAKRYVEQHKVLFVTADGRKVYEGDKVYVVKPDLSKVEVFWASGMAHFSFNKYFAYLLNALDYINQQKVLFTTHDGKEIREGDEYWCLQTETYVSKCIAPKDYDPNSNKKRFSTEQAANDYILFNRQLLSLEDLLSVWASSTPLTREEIIEEPFSLFKDFKALAIKKQNQ